MGDETNVSVAVFGAYGHTGRFVVAELADRGYVPVLVGRDPDRLRAMGRGEARQATIDDPDSLDRALASAAAVINCAGPFAETAAPLVEAALRAGIPYVDVAAEIEANADTFTHFAGRAREAGVPVVPAMAFYGGLGDLLVTAAMGDWTSADEVHVAYGLSSWRPTPGTLASGTVSGQRRGGRRVRFSGGRLRYHDDALPTLEWIFPGPLGTQPVIGEFTMADVVTVPSHIDVPEVRTYMTAVAAADLAAASSAPTAASSAPTAASSAPTAASSAPVAVDDRGRSAQTFVVDVLVRSAGRERRMSVEGQDIYAITAPLAVEAVDRLLTGRSKAVGVLSAGAAFDARDFLDALTAHLTVRTPA